MSDVTALDAPSPVQDGPFGAGSEWHRLRKAMAGQIEGSSFAATLGLLLLRAGEALPADGHLLDVRLPNSERHVRTQGTGSRVTEVLGDRGLRPGSWLVHDVEVLAVAMETGTASYGVLAAIAPDGESFQPQDGEVLATFARYAATCIEMAHWLDRAQEEERTARLLLHAARSLAGRQTEVDICRVIAESAQQQLGADRAAVVLRPQATGDVSVLGRSAWPPRPAGAVDVLEHLTDETSELWQLMASGSPVLLNRRSSVWARHTLSEADLIAVAAAPMMLEGSSVGIIVAAWSNSVPPASLGDASRERLWGLAGLAVVALDNSRLSEEIRHRVTHDPLTQLPNRGLFEDRLQQAFSQDAGVGDLAVIFGNVGRLRRVNESLGPSAGDELLRQVARRLQEVVREQDTVARYSGDEFAILVPGADRHDADRVADRIRTAMASEFCIAGSMIYVDLVLGVAVAGETDSRGVARDGQSSARRLMARATDAVHSHRAQVKGLALTQAPSPERLRLEAALHGAVSRGEISVHFQPQIDVASGREVALEALARWDHPLLGPVSPEVFIPLAEESGLIKEIGEYVLIHACREVAARRRDGRLLEVAVNVSAVQLVDVDFGGLVQRVLRDTGLPPEQLTLEVTESQVLTEVAARQGHLRLLRDLGIGISVDDFGTGYSSLAQLHRLPVTEVKIDRSFISGLADEQSAVLAAGIVGLGQGLGLRVVAEGVETRAQLEALRRLGCDRAQGFLIGAPCAPDSLHDVPRSGAAQGAIERDALVPSQRRRRGGVTNPARRSL